MTMFWLYQLYKGCTYSTGVMMGRFRNLMFSIVYSALSTRSTWGIVLSTIIQIRPDICLKYSRIQVISGGIAPKIKKKNEKLRPSEHSVFYDTEASDVII